MDNNDLLIPTNLPPEILRYTGVINKVEFIGEGHRCMKLDAEDENKYSLKKVFMPSCRIREYESICRKNISGFQKVFMVCEASPNDEYWVLSEWICGKTFAPVRLSSIEEEQRKRIKQIAQLLRKTHTQNKTECKVVLFEKTIKEIVDCGFISASTQEMLLSYMMDKLPLIQSRCTTVIHGDFHIRNIVIGENNDIVFIDVDDLRYGDPYIDLVYASNLIRSNDEYYTYYLLLNDYFDSNIPNDFWPVVNFYSIIKAVMIMKSEAAKSKNGRPVLSMEGLISQHSDFRREQPLWYTKIYEEIGGKN